MNATIDVVLHAGRSAVEVALCTLLPIMVLMMITMRVLEATGILDRIIALLTPIVRPFGLTGLGVLAMIQISFVSFVAPLTTLALMENRGASDRRLAAAFAAILAMAPANALFPLAAYGLRPGPVLGISALGGLAAAVLTYWVFGRRLAGEPLPISTIEEEVLKQPSMLNIINVSGREAIQIVVNIIPMLLLSLAFVFALERAGAIDALVRLLSPALGRFGVDAALVLPTVTKYLAGSTALVGVVHEVAQRAPLTASSINESAGFLLHPLDLPGVAIFISASKRLGSVCVPALAGALVGIALRTAVSVMMP
jgi:spore maturation protein SpmB